MDYFIKYIPYIIAVILVGIYAIYVAKTQPAKVKEWLIYACAYAENYLGSGTGKLKLRKVYDMFVSEYPIFSKFISFNRFQKWTEEALETFKHYLENNPKMQALFTTELGAGINEEKN